MMKWRDKKWLIGLIVAVAVAVVGWTLERSPNQPPNVNASTGGIATQGQTGNNVVNNVQTTHHFSETQSITEPKHLGNSILNLDNVAALRVVETKPGAILLLLDTPAIVENGHGRSFSTTLPKGVRGGTNLGLELTINPDRTIRDVVILPDLTQGTPYLFDLAQNQRHDVVVAGRTFTVTLDHFEKLNLPSYPAASKYVFGISEK
jgi:hypothetical protein